MNNNEIILKKTQESEYILGGITKETCEEIQALMRLKEEESDKYPFIKDIECCGHASEITEHLLKPYTVLYNTWNLKYSQFSEHQFIAKSGVKRDLEITEYRCYATKDRNHSKFTGNVIIHEDRMSSFNCALACVRSKFFYIRKISLDTISLGEGLIPHIIGATYKPLTEELINDLYKHKEDESTDKNRDTEICSED